MLLKNMINYHFRMSFGALTTGSPILQCFPRSSTGDPIIEVLDIILQNLLGLIGEKRDN
jgi:hypothetical protein